MLQKRCFGFQFEPCSVQPLLLQYHYYYIIIIYQFAYYVTFVFSITVEF